MGDTDISQAKQECILGELLISGLSSWEVREDFSVGETLSLKFEGSGRKQVERRVYGKGIPHATT